MKQLRKYAPRLGIKCYVFFLLLSFVFGTIHAQTKIQVVSKDISIPAGLSLVDFEPQTVLVSSEKYTKMEIAVVAKTKGNTPKEVELKGVAVTPEKIEVLVPQGSEAPKEIATEVIDVSSQTEPIIVPVKIILDEKFKLVDQADSTINVALDIQKVENN